MFLLLVNVVTQQSCIEFIDGTLDKILHPYRIPNHVRFFNGRKINYSINNTVVVDHNDFFKYIDHRYLGSFHDVVMFVCILMG